jgi:hypothetical protein
MKRNGHPNPTSLPSGEPPRPYIDPRVPKGSLTPADAYRAAAEGRRKLPKVGQREMAVAGGPAPRIPHLDSQPAQEGLTMQQHALRAEQQARTQAGIAREGGFVEPPSPAGPPPLNLMPADILPSTAQQDPDFIQGHGSMLAVNQPHLAAKYGVIRNGRPLAPQQLIGETPGKPKLSPETLRDIETLRNLEEQQRNQAEQPKVETAELGEAAGKVGNKPLSEEEEEKLKKALNDMDEFELDSWKDSMRRNPLNNPGQKEIIEARLQPLDLGDLVVNGYIIQNVPIIPGKFEVQFRTAEGDTDLALKRLIMEDSKSLEVSERYYLDKFSLMSMAAFLHGINKKVYPDYHDKNGDFDDDKFRAKFRMVIRLPLPMLASIGIHATWFEERVRQLFVMEKLGNG